ncbi:MAG TPA: S9 family peptidase [Terriglobales bacterium]|nr:S9 family peptidase [Terriglobales bacterium]
MKRYRLLISLLIWSIFSSAQNAPSGPPNAPQTVQPNPALIVEGIPPIPASIAQQADRYTQVRSAAFLDWHPNQREMLIGTRFGDVPQVHRVLTPGGARTQLTFFPDRVVSARYEPVEGKYFIFSKDIGGGEWFQYYRYDVDSGDITLLTDGKSRNLGAVFANHSGQFAYTSTRRSGQDTDVWLMDAGDPKTDHMLLQLEGGGWQPLDWSPDDKQLLLHQEVSANESYIWLVDVGSGQKKLLTTKGQEQIAYGESKFSKDGRGFYTTTDRDSEFQRLAYFDLATLQPKYLTSDIKWDVDTFDISYDGRTIAFVTNEDGASVIRLLDTASGRQKPGPKLPLGVIGRVSWHRNNRDVAFSLSSAKSPLDSYSFDAQTGRVDRWTSSETGGLNPATFVSPELIHWKTFDGKTLSGFLYKPPAKFSGKRPVIINIHGGPEGQSRPGFSAGTNYYVNELGVAVLFPNVRGSTGYGKTFLKLDNGLHRAETYKDIGTLIDWIKQNPELDGNSIMVTGGSYGGNMTWAVATMYEDEICCQVPIVGPTNLVTLLEHTEPYRRDLRRVEYGDERDPKMREYLEHIAPMNNSDKITKPTFVVAGQNDPRVPVSESQQMVDKLRGRGVPLWFLVAKDEGHGFSKKKNQDFQFYATIMFVKQYLLKQPVEGSAGQ